MFGTEREKRLRLMGWAIHGVGVLSLAAGACTYHFVVAAVISQQHDRNDQEADHLEEMVATKPQVEQDFQKENSKLTELQQRAQAMRDGIPDEPGESEFLRQLTQAAEQENLRIRAFQTGTVTQVSSHSQLDVTLRGEGDYQSICGFLERISRLPRIKTVQRMQIARSPGRSVYPIDMTLTLYFANRNAGKG